MLGSCSPDDVGTGIECDTDGKGEDNGWWLPLLTDSGAEVDLASSDEDDDVFDFLPLDFALPDGDDFWRLCTKTIHIIRYAV